MKLAKTYQNIRKHKKRLLACLLVYVIVSGLVPFSALVTPTMAAAPDPGSVTHKTRVSENDLSVQVEENTQSVRLLVGQTITLGLSTNPATVQVSTSCGSCTGGCYSGCPDKWGFCKCNGAYNITLPTSVQLENAGDSSVVLASVIGGQLSITGQAVGTTAVSVEGYFYHEQAFDSTQVTSLKDEDKYRFTQIKTISIDVVSDVPDAPQNVSASVNTANPAGIDVSWNAVEDAAGYKVYYTMAGTTESVETNSTTATLTGLTLGSTYSIGVTTLRDGRESVMSAKTQVTLKPGSVTLTATPGIGMVRLNWSAVNGAVAYKIYPDATAENYTSKTPIETGNLTYLVSGLTNGQKISFVVTSSNSGGDSEPAVILATPSESALPEAPTGLKAVSANDTYRADLNWNGVDGATGYEVYFAVAQWKSWNPITGEDIYVPGTYDLVETVTESSAVVTRDNYPSLSSQNYYIKVRALNGGAAGADSEPLFFTVTASAPQINRKSAFAGDGKALLVWSKSSNAYSYEIYQSTTSNSYGSSPDYTVPADKMTALVISGLQNGTTYYFGIKGVNGVGKSRNFQQVSVTPNGNGNWIFSASGGFAGGDGTGQSPFLISSAEELAYMSLYVLSYNVSTTDPKHYRLTQDIDLAGKTWLPIGFGGEVEFSGYFDGNGHVIKNMTIRDETGAVLGRNGSFIGLFEDMSAPAIIKNVGLENVDILGRFRLGGIAGFAENSSGVAQIYNSYVTGTISGTLASGGLVGYARGLEIANSYADVQITASAEQTPYGLGGIVGQTIGNTTIRNVYANIRSGSSALTGGIAGYLSNSTDLIEYAYATGAAGETPSYKNLTYTLNNPTSGTVRNSYYDTAVFAGDTTYGNFTNVVGLTSAQITGTAAAANMSALDFANTWKSSPDSYPVLRAFYTAPWTAAPKELTAVAGTGQVTLNWTSTGNGAQTYSVYYKAGSASSYTKVDAGSALTYTVTGLTSGTAYSFAVSATDSGVESAKTPEISAIPIARPSVSQIAVQDGGMQLTWTASAGATGYKIYYGTESGSYTETLDAITDTTATVTGLENEMRYYFAVSGVNDYGESTKSAEVSNVPPAPALSAYAGGQVTLQWNPVPGAIDYILYRGTSQGNYSGVAGQDIDWTVVGTTSQKVNAVVSGLADGNPYFFKVQAVYSFGNGPLSDEGMILTSISGLTVNSDTLRSQDASLPKVVSYTGYTTYDNDAPNYTQHAFIEITYDRAISLTSSEALVNELNITMGGSYSVPLASAGIAPDGKTLRISLDNFFAAYSGEVILNTLSRTGKVLAVSAQGGAGGANFPDILFYLPNGVKLLPVSQTSGTDSMPASVEKTVNLDDKPTRGMVQYRFLRNGQLVGEANVYGGNLIVHYHNYTSFTPATYAASIASTFNSNSAFSANYTATATNGTVRIVSKSNTDGEVLDLMVLAYPQDRNPGSVKAELSSSIAAAELILTHGSYTELKDELNKARAVNASEFYLQSEVDAEKALLNTKIGAVTGGFLLNSPASLSAVAGRNAVALSWSAVTGAAGYKIYYKSGTGGYGSPVSVTGTSYTVGGLTNGTEYTFAVSAVKDNWEGLKITRSATPTSSGPTGPIADTAPVITGYSVSTTHKGPVKGLEDNSGMGSAQTDHQYILLDVKFDKAIQVQNGAVDDLVIKLNGTASQNGETFNSLTTISASGNTLHLEIELPFAPFAGYLTVEALQGGISRIKGAGENGIAATWSNISLYVPNGLKLATTRQTAGTATENASVTKRVITDGNTTRGMVHLLFLKNGQLVGSANQYGANVTAHHHDYLSTTAAKDFAANLPGYLKGNSTIAGNYTITSSGDTVTITANSPNAGDILDLLVFAYPRDRETGADVSALSAAIAQAKAVDKSAYTGTAYTALQNRIAISEAIVAGRNYYLQDEVAAALSSLQSAISDKTGNPAGSGNAGTTDGAPQVTEPDSEAVPGSTAASATITAVATAGANGVATVAVSQNQIQTAVAYAQAEAGQKIALKLEVELPDRSTGLQVTMPGNALDAAITGGTSTLTISSALGDITFNTAALKAIQNAADGDIVVSVETADTAALPDAVKAVAGDRPVYSLSVTSGESAISSFNGGSAVISIPYTPADGENVNQLVICYISPEDTLTKVTDSVYDPVGRTVKFKTGHFSSYAIGYVNVGFSDVAGWYEDYVDYLAARDVIKGYGKGNFAPGKSITRAEFATILANLAGVKPGEVDSTQFTDISAGDWYASAVQWAYASGIVMGYQGKFNPDSKITRQDMAVMLLRYADKFSKDILQEKTAALTFKDEASVASYARDAVAAMQKAGIIAGYTDGSFAPESTATRAEASKMIALLIQGAL